MNFMKQSPPSALAHFLDIQAPSLMIWRRKRTNE